MKHWIVLTAACLACQAEAGIYKCKDAEGKVLYQERPCPTATLGILPEAPPVPEAERRRAQENLERMIETNRKNEAARAQEWQKKQEEARRLAEQEAQAERDRLARQEQENRERFFWAPWSPWRPWFNQNHPHQNRPQPQPGSPPRQDQGGSPGHPAPAAPQPRPTGAW